MRSLRRELKNGGGKTKVPSKKFTLLLPEILSTDPKNPIVLEQWEKSASGKYVLSLLGKNFLKGGFLIREFLGQNYITPFEKINNSHVTISIINPAPSKQSFRFVNFIGTRVYLSAPYSIELLNEGTGPGTPDQDVPPPAPSPPPSLSPTPSPSPTLYPEPTPSQIPSPTASPSATPTPPPSPTPTPEEPVKVEGASILSPIGHHIASIEVDWGSVNDDNERGIVRAVIPLPPDFLSHQEVTSGRSQFAIEDADGNFIPAQTQEVIKAPGKNLNDPNPDLAAVELIALVKKSFGGLQKSTYRVYQAETQHPTPPHGKTVRDILATLPFQLPNSIQNLLEKQSIAKLETIDIFGHKYELDLLAGVPEIRKYGSALVELRTFGVLKPKMPVSGPTGTYPRMFNVHTYMTFAQGQEVIGLQLKIGNTLVGISSAPGDVYINELYFKNLTLVIGAGDWKYEFSYPNPLVGEQRDEAEQSLIEIIRDKSGTHYFPALKSWLVRGALYRGSSESSREAAVSLTQNRWLGFAVDGQSDTSQAPLFSYFSPQTPEYLSHGMFVPTLDHLPGGVPGIRNYYKNELEKLKTLYKNDQCSTVQKQLPNGTTSFVCEYPKVCGENPNNPSDPNARSCGFMAALGVAYGGMTGGLEIIKSEGVAVLAARTPAGYNFLELQHGMRAVRNDQFHLFNGDVVIPEHFAQQGSCGLIAPIDYYNRLRTNKYDPFEVALSPKHQKEYALSQGLTPTDEEHWWNQVNYDTSAYQNEDGQHYIRLTRFFALVALSNDSPAKDDVKAHAGVVTFQHPHLAVSCNGIQPVFDAEGMNQLPPAVPGVGITQDREYAHMFEALVNLYSISDHVTRQYLLQNFISPWLQKVIIPGQMNDLGFLSRNNNFAKNSPTGQCWTAATNEDTFHAITNIAMHKRVFDGADQNLADALKNVIVGQTYATLIPGLSWSTGSEQNPAGFKGLRFRVPLSSSTTPYHHFTSWAEVPSACQNDSNNMFQNAGEYLMTYPQAALWTGDSAFSQAAQSVIAPSFTNGSLLQKLNTVNFYNLGFGNHYALMACVQKGLC